MGWALSAGGASQGVCVPHSLCRAPWANTHPKYTSCHPKVRWGASQNGPFLPPFLVHPSAVQSHWNSAVIHSHSAEMLSFIHTPQHLEPTWVLLDAHSPTESWKLISSQSMDTLAQQLQYFSFPQTQGLCMGGRATPSTRRTGRIPGLPGNPGEGACLFFQLLSQCFAVWRHKLLVAEFHSF